MKSKTPEIQDSIKRLKKTLEAQRKRLEPHIAKIKTGGRFLLKARQALDFAADGKKTTLGLQLIAFIYFQQVDVEKSNRCFQFIIEKLSRKLQWLKFLPLELAGDQKEEKKSEISKALWEHAAKEKYGEKPLVAVVNFAQEGKLDAIIITAVENKIKNVLITQRATKRGTQYERVEYDEMYSERPRRRENGKIDETYQDAISIDFIDPIFDIEEYLTELRSELSKFGNELLTYYIEYYRQRGELPSEKTVTHHFSISSRTVRRYRKKFKKNEY